TVARQIASRKSNSARVGLDWPRVRAEPLTRGEMFHVSELSSSGLTGRPSIPATTMLEPNRRRVLDRPPPRAITIEFVVCGPLARSEMFHVSELSSSGLTGRPSIPETAVLEPNRRRVLDRPPSRAMTIEFVVRGPLARGEMFHVSELSSSG